MAGNSNHFEAEALSHSAFPGGAWEREGNYFGATVQTIRRP
jgi:hypothetical protein